jgi:N-acetylmuramic acid 6-phosphate (MurNAc-6-P) etherase
MATQITITDADLAALVQAAKATQEKIDALVDTVAASVTSIQQDVKKVADSVTTTIPTIQAAVKKIADSVSNFEITGPMGIHGKSKA